MTLSGRPFQAALAGGVLVFLGFLAWGGVQRRNASQMEDLSAGLRRQIATTQARLSQAADPALMKQASAPGTRDEEAAFLTFLREAEADSHVQITRLQSQDPGTDMLAVIAKTPDDKALLDGLKPMGATLDLTGNYSSLLRFTNRLLSAPRLYNLNNLSWSRGKTPDDTHLSLFIVRYVDSSVPNEAGQVPKA